MNILVELIRINGVVKDAKEYSGRVDTRNGGAIEFSGR